MSAERARRKLAEEVDALDRLITSAEARAICRRLETQGKREAAAVASAPPVAPLVVPPVETLLGRIFARIGGDHEQQKCIRAEVAKATAVSDTIGPRDPKSNLRKRWQK